MNAVALRDLVVMTVKTPAEAARALLGLELPVRTLWLALALMAVLNAVVYALAMVLRPVPPEAAAPFLPSPFTYLVIVGLGLYGLVWALYLVGRWMGGSGSVADVLVLINWLQLLRVAAQAATLLVMMISSFLSLLMSMAILVLGIWIGLHFVNEAHRLHSLGKAAGVMVAAGIVTLMVVSVILSIVAAPLLGGMENV